MMKKYRPIVLWCALAAALLPACAGPRHILPEPVNPALCRLPFTSTSCRYIHALDAELPGGVRMTVMGVSVIDPGADTIQAAIMTLEGLLLFDATASAGSMQVHRAVPPFDGPQFAEGLMRDVRFIFMFPAGAPVTTGRLDDGSSVCRYQDTFGMTVDVIVHPGRGWEVEQHSTFGKKLRSLKIDALKNGIPGMLDFEAFSPKPYALHLKLLSAEPVLPGDTK
jgi:hypothetical protein